MEFLAIDIFTILKIINVFWLSWKLEDLEYL